jgi:thioredoxin 1
VEEVKSKVDFDRKLAAAGNNLVVVDFSASWCMPCKMIGPVFESLSRRREYKDVHFLKVDVDEAQDIAREYQIRSMPTFLFIRNGQVIENFAGALVDKLQSTVANLASTTS